MLETSIVQVVNPETGASAGPGESGEVVITSFNETYPIIRLGTGDLAMNMDPAPGVSRQWERAIILVGRVGEAVKVRGIFVHPNQLRFAVGQVGRGGKVPGCRDASRKSRRVHPARCPRRRIRRPSRVDRNPLSRDPIHVPGQGGSGGVCRRAGGQRGETDPRPANLGMRPRPIREILPGVYHKFRSLGFRMEFAKKPIYLDINLSRWINMAQNECSPCEIPTASSSGLLLVGRRLRGVAAREGRP